jgi:hypothetical protein
VAAAELVNTHKDKGQRSADDERDEEHAGDDGLQRAERRYPDDARGNDPHGESDHRIKDDTCQGRGSATPTLNVGGP